VAARLWAARLTRSRQRFWSHLEERALAQRTATDLGLERANGTHAASRHPEGRGNGRRPFPRLTSYRVSALSVGLGLVAWELYARNTETFVPPFTDVIVAWVRMMGSGELFAALAVSSQAFVLGLGLAVIVAVALGLILGLSDTIDHAAAPFVSALVALPSVAYIPIIMLWIGFGLEGRIAVVFEFCVLVMALNFRAGVRSVDPDLLEMARAFRLTRWQTFRSVLIPGSMTGIMAGLRLGLGRAIKGTVTAEVLLVLVGLGGLVKHYGNTFRIDSLLAVVGTIVLIALVLTSLLMRLDRRVNRWRPRVQDTGA
jgi:NitT/TauT family transport system permease protein